METQRYYLRHLVVGDAEELYELAKDIDVGPNAGWPPHTSIEHSRDVLTNILITKHNFGIFDKETGKFIGCIGLIPEIKRSNPHAMGMGYWVGKPYWRQGIATEVSKRIIQYAFEEVKIDLLAISHWSFNERSKGVIKKLKFTYEGCQRQARELFDGRIVDELIYSMTKEEYEHLKV